MRAVTARLRAELGVTNGYRHVINTGADGRQGVMHLHHARDGWPQALAERLNSPGHAKL